MRILITNDDGIRAPGLDVMLEIARELAGVDGEVWTVAPEMEQSGVAHAVSYVNPMRLFKYSEDRFAVDGMPADCILAGINEVMPEKPDLILSGVNKGNNAAQNTLYSGTIGAAIEGALHGIKSIALSQFYGPANKDMDDPFEVARVHGAKAVKDLLDAGIWGEAPYGVFYNINFPPIPAADCKGVKAVAQGFRDNTEFHTVAETGPNGRRFLWVTMGSQHEATKPGTDVHANLDGYISVTPMQADMTSHAHLSHLQEALK
ncbi:5'/3'-nucleotidase SurE [Amylibacter sp. SFDW26]|uniref:5'/3'-nucleotidase SurE n=1 Tax=Amylibacter sp. SFDW26 TaxID=2652722 RepID=UPI0012617744|nr:5'/3'-nucleotidase SurE [Amylibacter sp. SFDW26]KAB7616261.1 5'/3'-nucleotidase SurE [Amylibacter sp. SFDW26]